MQSLFPGDSLSFFYGVYGQISDRNNLEEKISVLAQFQRAKSPLAYLGEISQRQEHVVEELPYERQEAEGGGNRKGPRQDTGPRDRCLVTNC